MIYNPMQPWFRLASLLVLLVAAKPADAEWMRIGQTSDSATHYVDVDTLRVSGPRRIQFMVRIELAKLTYGMETRSIRVKVEHDCLLQRERSMDATSFTGPNLTGSADPSRGQSAWSDIQNGTLASELHRLVCRYR
jgi:hypothetical protein